MRWDLRRQAGPQGSSGRHPWHRNQALVLASKIPVGGNHSASPKGGRGAWGPCLDTVCYKNPPASIFKVNSRSNLFSHLQCYHHGSSPLLSPDGYRTSLGLPASTLTQPLPCHSLLSTQQHHSGAFMMSIKHPGAQPWKPHSSSYLTQC